MPLVVRPFKQAVPSTAPNPTIIEANPEPVPEIEHEKVSASAADRRAVSRRSLLPDIYRYLAGHAKNSRAPGELRIVFKISAAEKGGLQAQSFSIDQSGRPTDHISVTQAGATIRMTLAGPNGNYDGKLSPDGNTLTVTGDWDLGTPTAVILTKAMPETAWTIPEPPAPLVVMDPKAKPQFEVAAIKPSDPNQTGSAYTVNKSGMLITHKPHRRGPHQVRIQCASAADLRRTGVG